MRAYHLTTERWALESLKRRRLKIALLEDLNDPFELLGIELKTKANRKFFQELKAEVNSTIGFLCFSRSWNNPVLWSHYGDKHYGLCLGFDLLDEWTKEITYTGDLLKAELEHQEPQNENSDFGLKLITTKYEHWRYEDEIRLLIKLEHSEREDGKYFFSYGNELQLREVIAGPRSVLETPAIQVALSGKDANVSIIRSRLSFSSYKVVRV